MNNLDAGVLLLHRLTLKFVNENKTMQVNEPVYKLQ